MPPQIQITAEVEDAGRDIVKAQQLMERFFGMEGKASQAALAMMDKAGVTDKLLGTVLKQGLAATMEVSQGRDRPTATVEDYSTRYKYLFLSLMLKGYMPGKGGEAGGGNTFNKIIQINNPKEISRLP